MKEGTEALSEKGPYIESCPFYARKGFIGSILFFPYCHFYQLFHDTCNGCSLQQKYSRIAKPTEAARKSAAELGIQLDLSELRKAGTTEGTEGTEEK